MIGFRFSKKERFLYPGQELRPHTRGRRKAPDVMVDEPTRLALEVGRTRMMVAASLFAMVYLAIGIRLFDLMVLKSTDRRPPVSQSATVPLDTKRAEIVDRNGLVLATNLPTVNLYADSTKILNAEEATTKLLALMPDLNREEVLSKLMSGRRFIYLERNLSPRLQAAINAQGIPGIYFEDSERRIYPHGHMVSHVLGATDPDNGGIAGIERSFDQRLKDDQQPLRLSLDLRVQAVVRDTLLAAITDFQAIGGVGLVMDANNGQVIALVSLPDYDPAEFGNSPADSQFNRATLGVYEMGSTFKLLNTAMALDSGQIRVADTFDTSRPLKISRFTISDDHPIPRPQNVAEILVHSSNIGSARMAMALGSDHQREFLGRMGMLSAPPIELPEISPPLIPAQWREIAMMTISFGHGIAVTSVNLATAVSALVNGGRLYKPTLLLDTPQDAKQVIAPQTSMLMRYLMRLVVSEGTGKKADVPGYLIGGKTGSAEKVSRYGGYDTHNLRTTFAAAFPLDDPRYVVLTVLDEPKGLKSTYGFATAGWNAAPTTGKIISQIAPLLGVFPRLDAMQPYAPLNNVDLKNITQSIAFITGGARAPAR
ncbi:peptidoglycan D,D-transpeptidase FtsI family protein [Insolitispirillum peregrinum]|uniref:peptidoglycan D,D-transpeptidase FtsI family protein n=1 Tax=Insolitispirillum peregrinum TaxID=80876 RepID=UPI0036168BCD